MQFVNCSRDPASPIHPYPEGIFVNLEQLSREGHFERDAVLQLADFERFVFVMSVLEHYSEHDGSLKEAVTYSRGPITRSEHYGCAGDDKRLLAQISQMHLPF
jgi:hypothetical protein